MFYCFLDINLFLCARLLIVAHRFRFDLKKKKTFLLFKVRHLHLLIFNQYGLDFVEPN